MKKNKIFKNFLMSSFIVIMISASILSFALLGLPSKNENKISSDKGILINEKVLDDKSVTDLHLVLGEKEYHIEDNITQNLKNLIDELYVPASNAEVVFDPDNEEVFVFKEEVYGQEVNVTDLVKQIKNNKTNKPIQIPVFSLIPEVKKQDLEALIELKSQFTTSISSSPANRKHNVRYALSAFNGLVVAPDEVVSFNDAIKKKTKPENFKNAKIIVNGDYVLGSGGGICQASTTLYNALLLADMEILEVYNHSLPVSYVPRAFDAMVSEGIADLVFKNSSAHPIYIMTSGNDEAVTVKIFGEPFEIGLEIKTKTEHIKNLPHNGDKIVPDTQGKYYDKICFKGEYLRLRYPKEGSEDVGYLLYYKNGELAEQKKIRHVYYPAQEGIIVEGVDELYEGMKLPENEVKFINSQLRLSF
jgi:vancomycin resistance protein YoaR